MNLMYKFLPIYLLLEVCLSVRNDRLPHYDRNYHHSDQTMQQYNNYEHYDSYSSDEVVMRQSPRHSQLRAKSHRDRNIDFSDAEYNYKCKCSCTKCKKRKPKVKPCCEEFCSTECVVQNNILVVPYPVPFMVFNHSAPSEVPIPPMPTTLPSTTTATTSTTTERTTTCETTTTITTDETTKSTVPFFQNYIKNKRFHILNQNLRRGMGNNDLRSPKFGRLPKYGIVPIPENLALRLMQQIKKDENDDQLSRRLALSKNLFDYTRHIA